jgi:hypothetical protein
MVGALGFASQKADARKKEKRDGRHLRWVVQAGRTALEKLRRNVGFPLSRGAQRAQTSVKDRVRPASIDEQKTK